MRLLCLLSLFLVSCGGGSNHPAPPPTQKFLEQSASPDTGCHQGYATDGVSHFTFDTTRIQKRADDSTWHIVAYNDSPFAGLSGYNHLGDGDHFEGKLFVPAEQYVSCDQHANPSVLVFDAATLQRIAAFSLPQTMEISAVAVRPEARELWVSSYCDSATLWVYDLDNMTLQRTVALSPNVAAIQGLAFRDGSLYLAQNTGLIRRASPDGTSEQVYRTDTPGAHEGLDYSQPELRWLIDAGPTEKRVHYLAPVKSTN